jgi:acetoacetate decarboxylase
MPDFIEHHGDPQIPPPYDFPNVTVHSFRLTASEKALKKLCDARLNIGTPEQRGFEYRPIRGMWFVDLEVLHYPRMMSENKSFNWGSSTQCECYFRVFVGRYDYIGGVPVPAEVAVFIPYIFVDNAWSVISGREVVGFPKVMASFTLPTSETAESAQLYPIRIETDVFQQYSPSSTQSACPIVEIESSQLGPGTIDVPYGTIWPWGVISPRAIDQAILPFLQDKNRFSTVQLKQIRDAEQSKSACYQALIHGEFEIVRMEPLKTLPAADITIPHYDSLRIEEELGLTGGTLQPMWQYTLNCDLRYGNVRNLFVNT